VRDSDSATRAEIFRRQRERARTSLVNLVDAFLANTAKELVEDALDMIEAAAAQRTDTPQWKHTSSFNTNSYCSVLSRYGK